MGSNDDARRGLGIRPGAPPIPQLLFGEGYNLRPSGSISVGQGLARNPSPTTELSLNPSNVPLTPIDQPRVSQEPTSPLEPPRLHERLRRATVSKPKEAPRGPTSGLQETQNLLSHLLDQLERLRPPPDFLSIAATAAKDSFSNRSKRRGKAVQLGHAVVTAAHSGLKIGQNAGQGAFGLASQKEDIEEANHLGDGTWSTDETFELLEHIRSLLVLAERQDLDLFGSSGEVTQPVTPVKSKRKGGRLLSISSPLSPTAPTRHAFREGDRPFDHIKVGISGSKLKARMMELLEHLTTAPSLHHITDYSPLRPPNSLQVACLDIATYLYHRTEARLDVLEMIIDGLYAIGNGMPERLCEWIEGRLEEQLSDLRRDVGGPDRLGTQDEADPSPLDRAGVRSEVPAISLTVDESTANEPKQGWKRISPDIETSPRLPDFSHIQGVFPIQGSSTKTTPKLVRLASLAARALNAVISSVDLSNAPLASIYRFHRLVSLILISKPDSAMDLISIIAFAPSIIRQLTAGILSTYFPNMTGHSIFTQKMLNMTYGSRRDRWEHDHEASDDTVAHHYVIWRLSSKDKKARIGAGGCSICEGDIKGFAVRCTLCDDLQHLDCLSHPENVMTLDTHGAATDAPVKRVVIKYSPTLPSLKQLMLTGTVRSLGKNSTEQFIGDHQFRQIKLFSLMCCHECQKPLWDKDRVYVCRSSCQRVCHGDCLDRLKLSTCAARPAVSSASFGIDIELLKRSFEEGYSELCPEDAYLNQLSFDELAVIYGSLFQVYQTLKTGLTAGSLVILDQREFNSDPLDLRGVLRRYESRLEQLSASSSTAASDFAQLMQLEHPPGPNYLFNEQFLSYITALIRSPTSSSGQAAINTDHHFLSASPGTAYHDHFVADGGSYDALEEASIRRTLSSDLGIADSLAVKLILSRLEETGHLRLISKSNISRWWAFDLPMLIDSSPNVEVLLLSIDAMLGDLDLSMNELALRLAISRAWPSLLCAPFALERLGRMLVTWVMNEEDVMHDVVREFASKHRKIPGLRSLSGTSTARTSGPVQQYQEARNALTRHYILPWLSALHEMDQTAYIDILYDCCRDPLSDLPQQRGQHDATELARIALERIYIMYQAGITFSCLLDLVTVWLEDLGALSLEDHVFKPLPKLLDIHRHRGQSGVSAPTDIYVLAVETATSGPEGLARACRWMRVLACSDVEVPWETLQLLIDFESSEVASIEPKLDLVIAITRNSAPFEARKFAAMSADMLIGHCKGLLDLQKQQVDISGQSDLTTRMLSLCLRAYGVSSASLQETNFDFRSDQPASTLSKRRRGTMSTFAPFTLHDGVLISAARLLKANIHREEDLLVFMWLLLSKAENISNVDGTAHSVAVTLLPVIWRLSAAPRTRQYRLYLLLKLVSVHPAALQDLVQTQLEEKAPPAIHRLLHFILDLADDSVTSHVSDWHAPVVRIINVLFLTLLDPTDFGAESLLFFGMMAPTHLRLISMCYVADLESSNDENRLALLGQLHLIRRALPDWEIISWRAIEEITSETVASISHLSTGRSSQHAIALLDTLQIRCSVLALGLEMLASGVDIPWLMAIRFQQHVAAICAQPWQQPIEGLTALILPALRNVVDSSAQISVASTHSTDPRKQKLALVGSLFVSVVVDFASILPEHDVLTQRCILDILLVVFYKHNVAAAELSALAAIQTVADFVRDEKCAENRISALGVLQAAFSRVEKEKMMRIAPSVYLTICHAFMTEIGDGGDPYIIEQLSVLLRSLVKTLGRNGLFLNVLRLDGAAHIDAEDRSKPAESIMRLYSTHSSDTTVLSVTMAINLALSELNDILKRGRQQVEQYLEALSRALKVWKLNLSIEAIDHFGIFVNRICKHVADWTASEFDPNPILHACSEMLEVAEGEQAVGLLSQVSTLMHLCLSRFNVEFKSIHALLDASGYLAEKVRAEDSCRAVCYEVAGSGIHGSNVSPTTLNSLLQFLLPPPTSRRSSTSSITKSYHSRVLRDVSPNCVSILLRHNLTLQQLNIDPALILDIMIRSASVLLQAEQSAPGTLGSALISITSEAVGPQLGVFIYLLLASSDIGMASSRKSLLDLYPITARSVALALRGTADHLSSKDAAGQGAEMLSNGLMLMKLAFLAADDPNTAAFSQSSLEEKDNTLDVFWNRVWPDWVRLISLSLDVTCTNIPLRSVSHSVLLDLIIFLGRIDSPVLVAHATSLSEMMEMLVTFAEKSGTGGGKLVKAANALEHTGRGMIDVHDRKIMLDSIKLDLRATEKLRSLRGTF